MGSCHSVSCVYSVCCENSIQLSTSALLTTLLSQHALRRIKKHHATPALYHSQHDSSSKPHLITLHASQLQLCFALRLHPLSHGRPVPATQRRWQVPSSHDTSTSAPIPPILVPYEYISGQPQVYYESSIGTPIITTAKLYS